MHPMLNIAIKAARKAGDYISKIYESNQFIGIKEKHNNNFITKINYNIEQIVIKDINKFYPYHTIITKKGNKILGKNNNIQWMINPLSGNINFIKNFPHFAISIFVCIKDNKIYNKKYTEIAVIYDPICNELFSAARGYGAQLNNYRLRIIEHNILNKSIITINTTFKNKNDFNLFTKILDSMLNIYADFRKTGSTNLDLCYVAANRTDVFFAINLNIWDFLCAELIISESGGIIKKSTINNNTNIIIAGGSHIVNKISNILFLK